MNRELSQMNFEGQTASLRNLFQHMHALWGDYWFDRRHGLEVPEPCWEVQKLQTDRRSRDINHRPTRAVAFQKLMTYVKFPQESVFVDFGCGKGRLLLLALRGGFKKVVGVELCGEYCATALRNLSLYANGCNHQIAYEVIKKWPGEYQIRPDENVFCLIAPLAGPTLENVLNSIEESQESHPRDLWLICGQTNYQEVIEERQGIKRVSRFTYANSSFVLYASLRGLGRVKCTSPLGKFDDDPGNGES